MQGPLTETSTKRQKEMKMRMGPSLTWSVLAAMALTLLISLPGCGGQSGDVSAKLDEVESQLDGSEDRFKKAVSAPPAGEGVGPLSARVAELEAVHEEQKKAFDQLGELSEKSFTREEKARYVKVMARLRDRLTQYRAAVKKVREDMAKAREKK